MYRKVYSHAGIPETGPRSVLLELNFIPSDAQMVNSMAAERIERQNRQNWFLGAQTRRDGSKRTVVIPIGHSGCVLVPMLYDEVAREYRRLHPWECRVVQEFR